MAKRYPPKLKFQIGLELWLSAHEDGVARDISGVGQPQSGARHRADRNGDAS